MRRMEGTIVIDAPRPKVFAYASDWQRWSEWFEGISDVKATSSVTRGNGARYAYRARVFGVPASVETEIHDFEENGGWTGQGTKGVPHKTRWIFEDEDDGTRFTFAVESHLPIPLVRSILEPILEKEWNRIIEVSLKSLRAHFTQAEAAGSKEQGGG
jgi:uncharacterized protein YndB with AHSA1/START domain